MFAAATLAFGHLFTPPFRGVLFKSLALTVALLIAAIVAITTLFGVVVVLPGWLEAALQIAGGLGLVVVSVFLVAPITALIAGMYIDEIADSVEQTHYPQDHPGETLGVLEGLGISVKFGLVVIAVNIGVLFLLLLPGINLLAFYIGNGYLLGREFFEMAAMRYMPAAEARALRRDYRLRVFLSGLLIAAMVSVPILNLLTPLFATAFMLHTVKDVTGGRRAPAGSVPLSPRD